MFTHPCRDVVEQGAGLGEVGASWVRADDSLQRVPGGVAVVPATLLVRLVTGDLVAGWEPAQVDAFRPRSAGLCRRFPHGPAGSVRRSVSRPVRGRSTALMIGSRLERVVIHRGAITQLSAHLIRVVVGRAGQRGVEHAQVRCVDPGVGTLSWQLPSARIISTC